MEPISSSDTPFVTPLLGKFCIASEVDPENGTNANILLSLVIPTYNEKDNVENMLKRLTQLLDAEIPGQYELIIVDDNSPDLTWQVAQGFLPLYPQLRVMRRQQERGLASAVIRGWLVGRGYLMEIYSIRQKFCSSF
jgi:dolichol-phosphate mannosyltransferase